VEIVSIGYSRVGTPSIYPLDQALALPARSVAYGLQLRLVKAAAQNPFPESVETIADLTGVSVSKRSLEEILWDAAQNFDAFYQQRTRNRQTAPFGGSGRWQGYPYAPAHQRTTVQLNKGQKANGKRMATVAAVFNRAPWVRSPEQVVESLFRIQSQAALTGRLVRTRRRSVWASLLKGKIAVIKEVAQEMQRRDPGRPKNPGDAHRWRPSLAIREYLDHYNEEPTPFVWTADADLILGKIQRLCERISNSEGPHGPQTGPQTLHR